jgi:hypothetical protein
MYRLCLDDIKQSMHGKMSQHVVEETDTCGYIVFSYAIQFQIDTDRVSLVF